MTSVGVDMPRQQARVRELVKMYREPALNGAGEIAARLMEAALSDAEQAMASGDVVRIVMAYQQLTSFGE